MQHTQSAWKNDHTVSFYLEGTRQSIPFAAEHLLLLEQLLAQHPPRLFLDLGCGDGILSHYLMDRFPHSQAVLVDFSGPMLEKAGQR